MFNAIGADAGYDSINDVCMLLVQCLAFDSLESKNKLAKSIIYNLNRDNYLCFNDSQFSGWVCSGKFNLGLMVVLDQKDGMEDQMNILSSQGLLQICRYAN